MFIKSIKLENFRNYKQEEFIFEQRNIISGRNAQGKTNILEAIFYLTGGKSLRGAKEADIVMFSEDYFRISAEIAQKDRDINITAEYENGRRKKLLVNGVKLKTAKELAGRFCAVLFIPDDLHIIKAGAAARRRFMDRAFSQLRPRYVELSERYDRLHAHKTRILRDYHDKPALLDTLDSFNEQLAVCGAGIIRYRAFFLDRIAAHAREIHREISGGEELDIKYRTVSTVTNPLASEQELYAEIREHMVSHRTAEIRSGSALSGPHKDDLEIFINGIPARTFASQGQTRTAALSLKLAELELFFEDRGEYPVLLLDDVLSELDGGRRDIVLNKLSRGQIFITLCDMGDADRFSGRIFSIEGGRQI